MDVVSTLEAMQTFLVFYHNKHIITKKDLHDKIDKYMTSASSNDFTTKAVVDKNYILKLRKDLKINCGCRRKPTLPLLKVSRNATWALS